MVKNPPVNAEDARDVGLIPGSGRSPGAGSGNPSVLTCEIPWTEGPGGLQATVGYSPWGHKEVDVLSD